VQALVACAHVRRSASSTRAYLIEKAAGLAPVNSGGSFTGNSGAFAEYRVIACTISLKIPP
jgi:hypothetical protein